mgnify:CR=1 FL=1
MEINKVEAEAKQIAEDSKRLLETNNQLLADMQNRRIQLEDLLNRAQAQQEQVRLMIRDIILSIWLIYNI